MEYVNGVYTGARLYALATALAGENVTLNIGTIKSVPKTLKEPLPFLEVRGEVYMSDESFCGCASGRSFWKKSRLKTPRNAAAGSLRQKDPKITARARCILFLTFGHRG